MGLSNHMIANLCTQFRGKCVQKPKVSYTSKYKVDFCSLCKQLFTRQLLTSAEERRGLSCVE
jgi:hypothetical protein